MEKITIENATYKWFDMKLSTYDKLETDDSIYLYDDGDKYAEVRIDKKSKDIYYRLKLYKEFSEIIPLKRFEFEKFMVKWVEDTFGLKGFTPRSIFLRHRGGLKIPK